jgi:hypothetical protein
MKSRPRGIFTLLLIISTFLSHAQTGSRIKMKIESLKNQHVELWSYYGNTKVFIASVRFGENGLANYHSKTTLKKGVYSILLPNTNSFELIITEPKISLKTDLITPGNSMVIKKSNENIHYYSLKKFLSSKRVEMNKLILSHKDGRISTNEFNRRSQYINQEIKEFKNELVAKTKGLLVSDLLRASMSPSIDTTAQEPYADYLNKYLNQINFTNTALLYSPVMDMRVVEYVDLLVAPYPHEKIKAIQEIINRSNSNQEISNYFIKRFIEKYEGFQTVGYDEIFTYLVTNYLDKTDYSTSKKITLKNKSQSTQNLLRGAPFNIEHLPKGDLLYSFDSKYTLVLLWKETTSRKQLELIYDFSQSYKKHDLKVFSILIGTDMSKLNIGQKNKWVNVLGNTKFQEEMMMNNDIMLILLDKDKKITARDISLDFLIDTLNAWEK